MADADRSVNSLPQTLSRKDKFICCKFSNMNGSIHIDNTRALDGGGPDVNC